MFLCRWLYCCCEVAALLDCVFASMALSVRREAAALLHCTLSLSSVCVFLLALLGGARSLSQPGMSKRSRLPYLCSQGARITLVVCWGQAELAVCKTLAHPQIASICGIRPRHRLGGVDTSRGYDFNLAHSRSCLRPAHLPLSLRTVCLCDSKRRDSPSNKHSTASEGA